MYQRKKILLNDKDANLYTQLKNAVKLSCSTKCNRISFAKCGVPLAMPVCNRPRSYFLSFKYFSDCLPSFDRQRNQPSYILFLMFLQVVKNCLQIVIEFFDMR